jgi:hypothetical protein
MGLGWTEYHLSGWIRLDFSFFPLQLMKIMNAAKRHRIFFMPASLLVLIFLWNRYQYIVIHEIIQ